MKSEARAWLFRLLTEAAAFHPLQKLDLLRCYSLRTVWGGGVSQIIERTAVRALTGKVSPYVVGGVAGLVGAYFGLNKFEIVFLLVLAFCVAFFGPYQVRRIIRLWRRRNA